VLLAKNALAIIMGIIEIFEFFGEQRPRRCDACTRTFAKDVFKAHIKICSPALEQRTEMTACVETRNRNEKIDIDTTKVHKTGDINDNALQRNTVSPEISRKTYV